MENWKNEAALPLETITELTTDDVEQSEQVTAVDVAINIDRDESNNAEKNSLVQETVELEELIQPEQTETGDESANDVNPNAGQQPLNFWGMHFNDVYSASTTTTITDSRIRTLMAAPVAVTGDATRIQTIEVITNQFEQNLDIGNMNTNTNTNTNTAITTTTPSAASSIMRRSNGRSVSLDEGELQLPRNRLNTRQNFLNNQNFDAERTDAIIASLVDANGRANGIGHAHGHGHGHAHAHDQPINNEDNNQNQEDQQRHFITNMVMQMISHGVRYLPIICIILIKFVHDHLLSILDILLLQFMMYLLNTSLRFQVARLTQKNYGILMRDTIVVLIVIMARFYMASTSPDPLGLLVPPPMKLRLSMEENYFGTGTGTETGVGVGAVGNETERVFPYRHKVFPLGILIYYSAVSDLLLKLLTILVKICITLLPSRVIRLKIRARLFVVLEFSSQLYRSLPPITQWFLFLYESYTGLEFISGGLLAALYIGVKIYELIDRCKAVIKALITFKRHIHSERSPTKDELDAVGSLCPICQDAYTSPIILECNHIFCDACVQTWFKREQTCPMCRAKVCDDPDWQDGSTTFFLQFF